MSDLEEQGNGTDDQRLHTLAAVEIEIDKPSTETGELTPKPPTVEERARQQGWRPKEEFQGAEEDFIDAGEYIRRGSLFREIDKLAKQNNDLKTIVGTLSKTVTNAEERAYRQALHDIEARKNATVDIDEYKALVQQEYTLKDQYSRNPTPVTNDANANDILQSEAMQKFVSKNPWMKATDEDSTLKKVYAQQMAGKYEHANPGASVDEVLDYVDRIVESKFGSPSRPTQVSSSSMRAPGATSKSGEVLPKEGTPERLVLDYLKANGQDYKSYLKELNKQEKK